MNAARRYEQIGLPEIVWGVTLCEEKECAELADCRYEGYPYCYLHADDALEYDLARELNPGLAATLLEIRS